MDTLVVEICTSRIKPTPAAHWTKEKLKCDLERKKTSHMRKKNNETKKLHCIDGNGDDDTKFS